MFQGDWGCATTSFLHRIRIHALLANYDLIVSNEILTFCGGRRENARVFLTLCDIWKKLTVHQLLMVFDNAEIHMIKFIYRSVHKIIIFTLCQS